MELITISQNAQLEYDFEGAKARLEEQIAPYRNVVFTEDTKRDAKDCVANLRKDQKAFDTAVKEIKKEYMKPFDDFYGKAKELLGMYDEPIKAINDQIDEFELKRKQEKQEQIRAFYDELVPEEELQNIIPLNKIYNPKWENATATNKAIKEDIMTFKGLAKSAIDAIKGFHSDKEEQALNMYRSNLNLNECILYLQQYEQQKKEIEAQQAERIRREEEERIRRDERAQIEAEQAHEQEIAQTIEQAKANTLDMFTPVYDGVDAEEYSYTIKLTPSEKDALEMYMNSFGIEFDEVVF